MIFDRDALRQAAEMAKLSQHAYSRDAADLPDGWSVVTDSIIYEKECTGFYAVVYKKTPPVEGEARYAVSFRGTQNLPDILDDFNIAMRQLPRQFTQAVGFVNDICAQFGIEQSQMALTGHSLGGYLARTAGTVLDVHKVWAFNSPGPTQETRRELDRLIPSTHLPSDKLVQIRSKFDIISHWGYDEGHILELRTEDSHHSLVGLRAQIDHLRGVKPAQEAKKTPFFSLSRVFNEASKLMTKSRLLKHAIKEMFNDSARVLAPVIGGPAFAPRPALAPAFA